MKLELELVPSQAGHHDEPPLVNDGLPSVLFRLYRQHIVDFDFQVFLSDGFGKSVPVIALFQEFPLHVQHADLGGESGPVVVNLNSVKGVHEQSRLDLHRQPCPTFFNRIIVSLFFQQKLPSKIHPFESSLEALVFPMFHDVFAGHVAPLQAAAHGFCFALFS